MTTQQPGTKRSNSGRLRNLNAFAVEVCWTYVYTIGSSNCLRLESRETRNKINPPRICSDVESYLWFRLYVFTGTDVCWRGG